MVNKRTIMYGFTAFRMEFDPMKDAVSTEKKQASAMSEGLNKLVNTISAYANKELTLVSQHRYPNINDCATALTHAFNLAIKMDFFRVYITEAIMGEVYEQSFAQLHFLDLTQVILNMSGYYAAVNLMQVDRLNLPLFESYVKKLTKEFEKQINNYDKQYDIVFKDLIPLLQSVYQTVFPDQKISLRFCDALARKWYEAEKQEKNYDPSIRLDDIMQVFAVWRIAMKNTEQINKVVKIRKINEE